jgi:GxxExxY protein
MEINQLTERVIGACVEIHKALGPGLLESAYEECLCHELSLAGFKFERQRSLPVAYKGVQLDCGYRLDVVVEKRLIVELKSVEMLAPILAAQMLTYLKLSGITVGLLINFNVPVLRRGIKRIVNHFDESSDQGGEGSKIEVREAKSGEIENT